MQVFYLFLPALCLHNNTKRHKNASFFLKNPCLKLYFMTEEELQTRVIENIRSIRKKAGLSQERLADKADISRQMMNDIEGRRRWLTKNSLVKISNALNVDVSELFIPIQDENDNIRTFYDAITKKIKEQVKIALNNALETI